MAKPRENRISTVLNLFEAIRCLRMASAQVRVSDYNNAIQSAQAYIRQAEQDSRMAFYSTMNGQREVTEEEVPLDRMYDVLSNATHQAAHYRREGGK